MRAVKSVALAAVALAGIAYAAVSDHPPVAPMRPVTDTYFGTKVTDSYRWMEDRTAPEFVKYMLAQGAYARGVIDRIPGRDKLQARIAAHTGGGVLVNNVQTAGGHLFYMKREPAENTFKLYFRDRANGAEKLLLDPDRNATEGHHIAIDYYQPSQDGGKVAYGISPGGSEHSVIHVLDLASGKEASETIDRAENGGVSWLPDGSGFFYNRMVELKPGQADTESYLNSKVYLHKIGTDPATDVALIGTGVAGSPQVSPVDVSYIVAQPGSNYALAIISHGDVPGLELLIAPLAEAVKPGAHWHQFSDTPDGITNVVLHGDTLYLLTHKDAPRYKVIAVDAAVPDLAKAQVIVAPGERVVEDIQTASDALYIRDLDGGLNRLRRYDYASHALAEVALPSDGSIEGAITDPQKPGALFGLQGWVSADKWYAVNGTTVTPLSLMPPWSEDLSGYVAEEVKAPAKDGVMIPLSIVHRRGLALDGKAPVWLTGYGAYGISIPPVLAARQLTLLDDGGVFAVCHVRGGGEFGEDWHLAGKMATKPNTYRDLIACAEYLHAHGYGTSAATAIQGGSAGGITVGMALTERPDLFRVVISNVGDSNALRAEFETDGAANAMEYGSVKTEEGFRALAAVDALSHVKDHTPYPAVLLTTGLNDPRVAPWQPGKMAARLQAATSSGRPVLLLVDPDAGHGMGSTKLQRDREQADELAFFYWQIGKAGYQPKK
ncbi:MAG TPA: prolyl oligopeptidase family serine peptidase [Rhizomicrobium sp.]|jgi:prolyl oligopeptidase